MPGGVPRRKPEPRPAAAEFVFDLEFDMVPEWRL